MLTEAGRDMVAGWKAKDCAVYLVSALAVRGRTAAQGATAVNALVSIPDFYAQQVNFFHKAEGQGLGACCCPGPACSHP